MLQKQQIAITSFALRNWEAGRSGTTMLGISPADLAAQCNEALKEGSELIAGYAPFCRHLFLVNTSQTRCGFAAIADDNRHLLLCAYRSRRDGELAVLERWFEGLEAPKASYLDVILYHRSQLLKEADAFPKEQTVPDCEWGIVSIIGTLEAREPPIPPITQMRNALGPAQGGSGIPIDPEKYTAAVSFWQNYAAIK